MRFWFGVVAAILVIPCIALLVLMPLAPRLQLKGTLRMPKEWGLDHFNLSCVPIHETLPFREWVKLANRFRSVSDQEMVRDQLDSDLFKWSMGDVPQGKYRLQIEELGVSWEVDSTTGTAHGIELAVPPPAELRIHVCSFELDGEEVSRPVPSCFAANGTSAPWFYEAREATWDSDQRVFRCVVPVGTVDVEVGDGFEVVRNKTTQVKVDGGEVSIVVRRIH